MTYRGAGAWRGYPVLLFLAVSTGVWAADPQSATPLGNPGEWVTTADYPAKALADNEQGTVFFRLTIDTRGRVENCQIVQSSGTDLLDTTACNLISERARFSVATDASGRPVQGLYSNRVRWVLPKEMPQPRNVAIEGTYIVETDGRIDECKFVSVDGMSPEAAAKLRTPCQKADASTKPFLDESGNPVRKLIRVRSSIHIEPAP